MNAKKLGASLTAIAGVAMAAVAGTPGAAAAATTPVDVTVRAATATLRPAPDGGYAGTMAVRLSYTGPDGAYLSLRVTSPEGLFLGQNTDLIGCTYAAERFTEDCLVNGPDFVDGETRELRIAFRTLAKPTEKSRPTLLGSVTATASVFGQDVSEATPRDNTSRFRGLLVGTGSGFDPHPYRPSTTYDLSAGAVTDGVTFTPAEDGEGYDGAFTATVRNNTDAFHHYVEVTLQNEWPGLEGISITPSEACVWGPNPRCTVAGGELPEGQQRTVTLTIHTSELPPAGTAIQALFAINVDGGYPADATPADNLVTLPVR